MHYKQVQSIHTTDTKDQEIFRPKIGFIGLGNMGSGMALNLNAKGYQFLGCDTRPEALESLAVKGVRVTSDLSETIRQSDIILSSLPGPDQLKAVALGPGGIFETARPSLVWVDMSTCDIATGLELHARCKTEGVTMIDAPVTGGAERAVSGELTMLIGGSSMICKRLEPVFSAITTRQHHMGGPGAGYAAKLCQLHLNYLVAMGMGEALMLAARYGLDLEQLSVALKNSCAQSYVVDQHVPQLLNGDYDSSFTLGLALKDLRLIEGLADHVDVELELGQTVADRYEEACAKFGAEAPHLSVVRIMEERYRLYLRGDVALPHGRTI